MRNRTQVSGASLELFLPCCGPKSWDLGRREAPRAGGAASSGMLLALAAPSPVLTELKGFHSSSEGLLHPPLHLPGTGLSGKSLWSLGCCTGDAVREEGGFSLRSEGCAEC